MELIKTILAGLCLFLLLGMVNATPSSPNTNNPKTIYGYIEQVNIQPDNITLAAKLDTGALTASLNAININQYQKDGGKWVGFDFPLETNKLMHFEKPLTRIAEIKRRLNDGDVKISQSVPRPVVMMEVCLKQRCQEIEVNLANRSNFDYPLLLGRNAMIAFNALIDPSQKHLQTQESGYEQVKLTDDQ